MEEKQFLLLKEKITQDLLNYEHFRKNEYLLDLIYFDIFKDYIIEEFKILEQNKIISNIIKMLLDKENLDAIDNTLKALLKEYKDSLSIYYKKSMKANEIHTKLKSIDTNELQNIEDLWVEIVATKHPALRMANTDIQIQSFEQLAFFYFENSLSGLLQSLQLTENVLTNIEIKEEMYDQISEYYNKIALEIYEYIQARKDIHPFNKQEIINDDMKIIDEKVHYEFNIKQLKEANEALNKDLVALYGEEINFE